MTPPVKQGWSAVRARLRADRARLRDSFASHGRKPALVGGWFPGYLCNWLFRVSHYLWGNGHRRGAHWFWLLNVYLTGADIAPRSEIGGGMRIPHPAGIALDCRAGTGLTVMACAAIGAEWPNTDQAADSGIPVLGDNVHLGHHSVVFGQVEIGGDVHIAPGCVVTADVAAGTRIEGPSPKIRPLPKKRAE